MRYSRIFGIVLVCGFVFTWVYAKPEPHIPDVGIAVVDNPPPEPQRPVAAQGRARVRTQKRRYPSAKEWAESYGHKVKWSKTYGYTLTRKNPYDLDVLFHRDQAQRDSTTTHEWVRGMARRMAGVDRPSLRSRESQLAQMRQLRQELARLQAISSTLDDSEDAWTVREGYVHFRHVLIESRKDAR